jgi:hypothetical protein
MFARISLEIGTAQNSGSFVMDLLENILSAETPEEIFEAQQVGNINGQDFADRPFVFHPDDVQWMPSTKGGQVKFYAMMRVKEYETDEELTVACGGLSFMVTLESLRIKGYFKDGPRTMVIRTKKTNSGTDVLLLMPWVPPSERPKRGKAA